MHREDDDEAWRAIVENFGERADLDDGEPAPGHDERARPEGPEGAEGPDEDLVRPARPEPGAAAEPTPEPTPEPAPPVDDEDRFVPPDPGPLPVPAPDRGIAWIGVFGAPVVLLVSLLVGIDLPRWVGWLMVAWFVGGFVYLVRQMPHEPRDPWDDGSRI